MKTINKSLLILLCAIVSSFSCSAFSQEEGAYLVIIDRTKSMLTTRSATGNSRYYDAIEKAKTDIVNAYLQSESRTLSVAVKTFGNEAGGISQGFESWTSALQTLDSLQANPPTGGEDTYSPVVDAICMGSMQMYNHMVYSASSLYRIIGVYTDLDEQGSNQTDCSTGGGIGPVDDIWGDTIAFAPYPLGFIYPEARYINFNMNVYGAVDIFYDSNTCPPSPETKLRTETKAMLEMSSVTSGNFTGFADYKISPEVGAVQWEMW